MILTSKNIDTVLHDAGNLIVARHGDDGNVHLGKIHPHETVAYDNTVTYSNLPTMVQNLQTMQDDTDETVVAVVHYFPNRQSAQFVVKYGEVL